MNILPLFASFAEREALGFERCLSYFINKQALSRESHLLFEVSILTRVISDHSKVWQHLTGTDTNKDLRQP